MPCCAERAASLNPVGISLHQPWPGRRLKHRPGRRISCAQGAADDESSVLRACRVDRGQLRDVRVTDRPSDCLRLAGFAARECREIATALHLHLPAALITGLAEHGIRTLGDIRSAGGLSRIEGLTVAPEDPALQIVEAHAQLNLLPSDLAVNAMLIERGYTSLADMANVSRQTFVASLGSSL